jgi:tripeptidyl-peptidase-1
MEERSPMIELPRGWELHPEHPDPRPDHIINLKVGLVQAKIQELIGHLMEVSDPANSRYRKHLNKGEVEELVAPHPDSIAMVEEWLRDHDIDLSSVSRSPAGDWISCDVTVAKAEKMMGTKYNVYKNVETGSSIVRARSYSLPRSLTAHIDLVQPTTFFGFRNYKSYSFIQHDIKAPQMNDFVEAAAVSPQGTVPSSCGTTITPACLRALYNTANYVPKATSSNVLGVAGYLNEYANRADLQTFFKKYRTDAVGANFTTELVNGGKDNQSQPGVEANLDIQYTEGMSYPTPNIYYSTGGSPPYIPDSNTPTNTNEPYIDWLNYIMNKTTVPQTFTTSYGDDEQTVPQDYAIRVCNTFAQLGARGSSVLFSSGDGGVGSGDCKTNDGTQKTMFQPTFPGACPYITSVGGTYKVNPEKAVSFSQGGFSNYFARPDYQSSAVSAFLTKQGTTYSQYFNASGRGFPDVAAQGQGFQVAVGGRFESVGGTSASSPTFAGVVALLNDYLISQGKPTLGFLNPWLYSKGYQGLTDITSGSNPGCGTNGFTATAGWDPVTGLGTPDFTKLQTLV